MSELSFDCGLSADEVIRLNARPGLHGMICRQCNDLFDGFDTPCRLDEAIMRMRTAECPTCSAGSRDLGLLMPRAYRDALVIKARNQAKVEAVRRVADLYIGRDGRATKPGEDI